MSLINLFPTPVVSEMWPGAEDHNATLAAAITAQRLADSGVNLSNILGWQSDDAMVQWGGPAAAALIEYVRARCDAMTVDTKALGAGRRFRWVANMWANQSDRGASNQTHCHPGAYWSVVYYVNDGYTDLPDPALGGELVFLDPRMPMIRMGAPDLRYRRPDGQLDHQEMWFKPVTGRLVYFPSWLMHSVRPYYGDRTRTSIAMNLSAWPEFGT